jgi:hypothetical protein
MNLEVIQHVFRFSFRMLWTGANEISGMLATLHVVVLTFLRTGTNTDPHCH